MKHIVCLWLSFLIAEMLFPDESHSFFPSASLSTDSHRIYPCGIQLESEFPQSPLLHYKASQQLIQLHLKKIKNDNDVIFFFSQDFLSSKTGCDIIALSLKLLHLKVTLSSFVWRVSQDFCYSICQNVSSFPALCCVS